MTTKDKDNLPSEYIAGKDPVDPNKLPNFDRFTKKQLDFLEDYAKHLEVKKAAKKVGVPYKTASGWMRMDKFARELAKIEEIWATNVRMTADHASAKHIELMDKMEAHLDANAHDTATASKVMNPLAKMSDTYLKAAGKFAEDTANKGVTVNINVTKAKDEPVTIDGETIDED